MPTFAPGTPVAGSSDPRTVEQNRTIQGMQTEDGSIGSQYAGLILAPDGSTSRDPSWLADPAAQAPYLNAHKHLNAAGVRDSGGYVLAINEQGNVISYVGVSMSNVQTNAQAQMASVAPSAAGGYSHADAIRLAMNGVQTDGTPVTASYLDLMAKWAAADGIPFTRPNIQGVTTVAAAPAAAPVTPRADTTPVLVNTISGTSTPVQYGRPATTPVLVNSPSAVAVLYDGSAADAVRPISAAAAAKAPAATQPVPLVNTNVAPVEAPPAQNGKVPLWVWLLLGAGLVGGV